MRDSTEMDFSHSGVTKKRRTWFEVLSKPWMQVNRKALRGRAPDQNRLTATSHQSGARMALVEVPHRKTNLGLPYRHAKKKLFSICTSSAMACKSSSSNLGTSYLFCNTHWTGHPLPGSVCSHRYNVHSSHVTKGSLERFHLSKVQHSPEHPLGQGCVLFAQPSPRFFIIPSISQVV